LLLTSLLRVLMPLLTCRRRRRRRHETRHTRCPVVLKRECVTGT
jgi:hypothetical protein